MSSKQKINEGIPTVDSYNKLINSDFFREMEKFSDQFLLGNNDALKYYIERWVADPLHQWSRQWEYPFVFNKIASIQDPEANLKVLDAGSGVTFFPYLLQHRFKNLNLYCCDYDDSLADIYANINENYKKKVTFNQSDLRNLNYDNNSFDIIYCISVLEHTDQYEEIIEKFTQMLKPNGSLILTIDISFDQAYDIPINKAKLLLDKLDKEFNTEKRLVSSLASQISNPGILTTKKGNQLTPKLLPWKSPPSFRKRIKSFLTTGSFGSWPPPLTVYCLSLTKK